MPNPLPRYDWTRSYEWNYDHFPAPVEMDVPPVPGQWDFCGLPVESPLGIPAGPLLNGGWCLYYASLGFDVLTYKTVRSRYRKCYEMPNLQPVECGQLVSTGSRVRASGTMSGSWAVSFGMPSQEPDKWRADVEATRRQLPPGKLLSVSVVGSIEPGWSIDQLADDYARCAKWAVESGADIVETNFSCPNVSTCDGQLYQIPDDAKIVAACVRDRVPGTPYLVKVGHVEQDDLARELVAALDGLADGLAMTNSVAATIANAQDELFFEGQLRGICGEAILSTSVQQVARFAQLIAARNSNLRLVGVGGVRSADDLRSYCEAGAHAVHLATEAMNQPETGIKIRKNLAEFAVTP